MAIDYDRIAAHYDSGIRPLEKWLLAGLRRDVFNALPANGRILEIGAGTGANFSFYPADVHGVATEPSKEMLDIARGKSKPLQVVLTQNCAEQLPFEDRSFDAAFATLVFCSVDSPARAFAEIKRVVRQNGSVVLLEHVRPVGLLGLVFDVINLLTVPLMNDHFNRRTAECAQRAGLEVVKVRKRAFGIINLIECRV